MLARQLADRHVGTDEEFKHYLARTLKARLKWDKTHATDAMDWQDRRGLPRDKSPRHESPRKLVKTPRPARADAAVPLPEDLIRTLPPRQQVIARLVVQGKKLHQIARRLGRKPSQVAHLRGEMSRIKNAIEANKRRII